MKLTDREKKAIKEEIDYIRDNHDVEMASLLCMLANDFHKTIRDAYVPYIKNGYFHGKGELFVTLIVTLCSMITIKEIEALSNNDKDKFEKIKSLFIEKLNTSQHIRNIARENPELFGDH